MTQAAWEELLSLFDENERRILKLQRGEPVAKATFWRDSAHGTLGHLTACQSAWLPLLKMLDQGLVKGSVAIRPDPLYTKFCFGREDWDVILKQFKKERAEWRRILKRIDVTAEITTPVRTHTAQTLTKRLVSHEKRHLDDLAQNSKSR